MKGKNNNNFKRRVAAILAIVLVLAMVLSIAAPFFGAYAYGAKTSTVQTVAVNAQDLSLNNELPKEIDDGRFSVDAEIGFNNEYIVNKSTPFKFVVTNNGSDFKGQIQLKVYLYESSERRASQYAIYYVPIELAKNSVKEIKLSSQISSLRTFFTVSMVDEKEKTVYLKNFKVTARDPQSVWTAVLSDSPAELVYIKQNDNFYNEKSSYYYGVEYFNTFYLSETSFPDNFQTLNNFKMVMINDFDTKKLNENQISALKKWVEAGGIVVLGTGVNAQKVLGGLSDLADFKVSSATDNILASSYSLTISDAKLDKAKSVLEEGGITTTSMLKVGNGNIILHGFDLGKSPVPEIEDMASVLRTVYETASPESFAVDAENYYKEYDNNYGTLQYLSGRMAPVKGMGITIIFIIIGIYILAVGPAVYIFLKKVDKREKGWIIIPLLAISTTIIVYLLGASSYYRGSIINVVSQIDVDSGSNMGVAKVFAGIKSGDKGELKFNADEDFDIDISQIDYGYVYGEEEVCALKVNAAGKSEVTFVKSESWAQNNIATSKIIDLGGAIEADIKLKGNKFVGTITNNTSYDLEDLVLDFGTSYTKIDRCMQGETVEIDYNMEGTELSTQGKNYMDTYDQLTKLFDVDTSFGQISEDKFTAFGRARATERLKNDNFIQGSTAETPIWIRLYAFNKESIIEGNKYLNGKKMNEQNENIFVMDIPVNISAEEGFVLPFGFLEPASVVDDNGYDMKNSGNYIYVYPAGNITCNFILPQTIDIKSFEIKWASTRGTMEHPEIFNYKVDEWEPIKNGAYEEVESYVSEQNEVLVRTHAGDDSEIEKPQISIKGGKQ